MKKKYYVVLRGRQRGIFDNWGDCQDSIAGYKGADYQGFCDLESAAEYMEGICTSGRFLMVLRGRWKCYHNFDEFIMLCPMNIKAEAIVSKIIRKCRADQTSALHG